MFHTWFARSRRKLRTTTPGYRLWAQRPPALEPLEARNLPAFIASSPISTERGPVQPVLGYFDAGANLDLAVVNRQSDSASVFLGTGTGTFTAKRNYRTGSSPNGCAAGDLNGDGAADLLVGNFNGREVNAFLGTGAGTFQPRVNYPTGYVTYEVALGDFNNDGRLDIAKTNLYDGSVSVLLNTGNGNFEPPLKTSSGIVTDLLAAGDFNRDGKLDLVVGNGFLNPFVAVLLGKGDGTFEPKVDYNTGSSPQDVVVGDLNGDGFPDFLTADSIANQVSVFLNTGAGAFAQSTVSVPGAYPTAVAIGDVNRDGKADFVTANGTTNNITLFKGNGDATFQNGTSYAVPGIAAPEGIVAADLNHDRYADVVVIGTGSNNLVVLANDTVWTPQPPSDGPHLVGASLADAPPSACWAGGGRDDGALLAAEVGVVSAPRQALSPARPAAALARDVTGADLLDDPLGGW
jgi:hypothetical protein